jgi:Uma2 family endonuclease
MAKPAILPSDLRHVRPVQPLQFPSSDPEWDMPESTVHGLLCELVRQILRHALGREHAIGMNNFVYFDATHPERRLAPDGFVKLGFPRDAFRVWKTWERGTPELCVEILSPSDTKDKLTLPEKLERYRALGTAEVVAFDVDAPAGTRLRAWDRIEDDLVERIVEGETTPCLALGLQWVLAHGGEDIPVALRLAKDATGQDLLLTGEEAAHVARVAADAARLEADAARLEAEAARLDAEAVAADALAEVERLKKLLADRGR